MREAARHPRRDYGLARHVLIMASALLLGLLLVGISLHPPRADLVLTTSARDARRPTVSAQSL